MARLVAFVMSVIQIVPHWAFVMSVIQIVPHWAFGKSPLISHHDACHFDECVRWEAVILFVISEIPFGDVDASFPSRERTQVHLPPVRDFLFCVRKDDTSVHYSARRDVVDEVNTVYLKPSALINFRIWALVSC